MKFFGSSKLNTFFSNKNRGNSQRVSAFTLAEVLIALTIIGVVAAITIPQLVKNMNDYAFAKSKELTLAKITEATNQMKSNDALAGYSTNDIFVNEFQKYIKITNRCDSSNLTKCFPAKFKTGSGVEIDTATLSTGTQLGINNLNSNTIGLMLGNGTSMLFTLRDPSKVGSSCDRIDPVDNQTNTTSCMSFLYDINGYGSPNVIGKDINAINVNLFVCPGKTIGSLCVDNVDLYADNYIDSISPEYAALKAKGLITYDSGLATDRWAGTVKTCDDKGMRLPTRAELQIMYNNKDTITGFTTTTYPYAAYLSSEEQNATFYYLFRFDTGAGASDYKLWGSRRYRCVH